MLKWSKTSSSARNFSICLWGYAYDINYVDCLKQFCDDELDLWLRAKYAYDLMSHDRSHVQVVDIMIEINGI